MMSQVLEWNQLWRLKTSPVKAPVSRLRSRRRTRARRTPATRPPRTRERLTVNDAAAWYALVADGEIGEQVERARDEEGAVGAGQIAGVDESGQRVFQRFDRRETRRGAPRELRGRKGP